MNGDRRIGDRQTSHLHRGSKHPAIGTREVAALFPCIQHFQHLAVDVHGTLQLAGFFPSSTTGCTVPRSTRSVHSSQFTSHCSAKHSLIRSPKHTQMSA